MIGKASRTEAFVLKNAAKVRFYFEITKYFVENV